jgi:hypothetical protein
MVDHFAPSNAVVGFHSSAATDEAVHANLQPMKAWRVHNYGRYADELRLEDVPTPAASGTSSVVRVLAAGVNFADIPPSRAMPDKSPSLRAAPRSSRGRRSR